MSVVGVIGDRAAVDAYFGTTEGHRTALALICRWLCQGGRGDRGALAAWLVGWSVERGAGLGVGVASLMMRGSLWPQGPVSMLPASAV